MLIMLGRRTSIIHALNLRLPVISNFMQPWTADCRFTSLCDKNLSNYAASGAMRKNRFQDLEGPKRRKSQRHPFAYPAELRFENGLPATSCRIVDMSETGAQLEMPAEMNIHDEFILLIGAHTDVRRQCQVIWRSNSRIGVRFVNEPKTLPQSLLGKAVLQTLFSNAPKART